MPVAWCVLDVFADDGVISDIPSPHDSFFGGMKFVVDTTDLAPLLEVLKSAVSEVWCSHITCLLPVCSKRFCADPSVPLVLSIFSSHHGSFFVSTVNGSHTHSPPEGQGLLSGLIREIQN